MQILVRATEEQKLALLNKGIDNATAIVWVDEIDGAHAASADAIFDLIANSSKRVWLQTTAPVFINELAMTCKQLPGNYIRINAWPGFFEKDSVEISAGHFIKARAENVLDKMGWRFITAPDEPGMIGASIISMIINEACYALEEKVSTREAIDIAMKLGTNYPYGPFEWSEKIGLQQVYKVLKAMAEKDKSITVSRAIEKEGNQ